MITNKNHQVRKFFKIFFPFCLALIVADRIAGYTLAYQFKRQEQGSIFMLNYAVNEAKAEYLVVGSSRANHHYVSNLIKDRSGKTVYNAGIEGRGIIYSAAIVSASIHRFKPELVIIEVRPDEFTFSDDGDLTSLLPYYENKYIRQYINYNKDFQDVKLLSKVYPYNSLFTTIIAGRFRKGADHSLDNGGFIPLHGVIAKESMIKFTDKSARVEDTKVRVFKELLQELEKEKIKSLIILSPLYFDYVNGPTVEVCRNTTSTLKYSRFINFANTKRYFDSNKFQDPLHLNEEGAIEFSNEISDTIKTYMSK